MGRLPAKFAGETITFRVPYSMPGELVVTSQQQGVQFPEATFLHNVDKPFEIHRVHLDTTGEDDSSPPLILNPPLADTNKLVRVNIRDTSKNETLTKAAHLLNTLVLANTGTWEWDDPYTLVRSEGFQVSVDAQAFTNYQALTSLRVEVTFQGFLIVIGPPTGTR